jgi:hypothetical protein
LNASSSQKTSTTTPIPWTPIFTNTFGITSDALSQFAVAFSALVHDKLIIAESPTSQLKEKPELGESRTRVLPNKIPGHCLEPVDGSPPQRSPTMYFTNVQDVKRFRQYVVNLDCY